jgi:hypothetical protein
MYLTHSIHTELLRRAQAPEAPHGFFRLMGMRIGVANSREESFGQMSWYHIRINQMRQFFRSSKSIVHFVKSYCQ